ncbi:hypothetical protein BKA56DRAFT_89621 [Ilyonectria sp. MPI-CAGE-AT-0026]|nr:hypothetical protein BKA56DRAFT_89621 [Ilyonectria sp. MPI-CAGE-AT-0026]
MQTPVCAASFLPGANIGEVHDLPEGHAWRAILRSGVSQPFGLAVAIDQTPLSTRNSTFSTTKHDGRSTPHHLRLLARPLQRLAGLDCARALLRPLRRCDLTLDSAADAWEPRDPWERLGNTSAAPGGSVDYGATWAKGPDHCRMSACPEPQRCEGLGGPGNKRDALGLFCAVRSRLGVGKWDSGLVVLASLWLVRWRAVGRV